MNNSLIDGFNLLPPCEMMVQYFLPNMRGLVAHELSERGVGQRKIASFLGVTQARVSHYLSRSRLRYASNLSKHFASSSSEFESYSRILAQDISRSQVDGIFTLYSIWKNLLFEGNVCAIHQEESGISSDCAVCMELHRPPRENERVAVEAEDDIILRNISEAISLLENSVTFPLLMPEVSVNLAMAKTAPKTVRDVAAIPGRLNKIHGRAKAFVLPEFGCSNHMSNVVLIFNSKSSIFRSAMNLRFDQSIDDVLATMEIPKFFTKDRDDADRQRGAKREKYMSGDENVLERLVYLSIPPGIPSPIAVIDRGSTGVEPNTYLIGQSPKEVSELALKISHGLATSLRSTRNS